MRTKLLQTFVLCVALGLASCGSQSPSPSGHAGSGGSKTSGAGGSSASPVGGSGSGGNTGTGGAKATGGNGSGSGGDTGTGGAKATGGNGAGHGGNSGLSTGGIGVGGNGGVSAGGNIAAGGVGSGGNAATGGAMATGGGGTGKGGNTATGGSASGGTMGIVDASPGDTAIAACPATTPKTGGTQYCSPPANGKVGNSSYTYDLWSDGQGSGCLTVYGVDATFKANWTNVGDWIARVGLAFDKSKTYDQLGTFSSDFAYTLTGVTTGGFGNIGIYGWSVNPLHEYYIAENWLGKKPNFTKVGTFTIDGEGTYDVMTNQQKNAPNITGTNQDFVQFWSVNQTPRQCGHISITKHFAEWASLGLQLGKMEETRFLVEGQNNSGTIDLTTLTIVAK
jgi:endo-1,4-beta-xylanase